MPLQPPQRPGPGQRSQQQQLQGRRRPAQGQPAAGAGGKGAGATAAPGAPRGQKLRPVDAARQQGLTQAAEKGNLDVFLAKHPGLKNRFAKVAGGAGTEHQRGKVEAWQKANAAAKAAGQPPPPVSTGAPGGKAAPPPNTGRPTTTPPPTAPRAGLP